MEATKLKHTQVKQIGEVVVITPLHALSGGDETDELKESILRHDAQGNESLLINLKEVEWMSTMGITVLIQAHKRFTERGAQVKMCSLNKRLMSLITLTRLVLVFDICDTEEDAIEGFAGKNKDDEKDSTDSITATA